MKVTDVRTVAFNTELADRVFVQVLTDAGISGWGEATLEGNGNVIVAAIEEIKSYVVGKDPTNVEAIWQSFWRTFWAKRGGVILMTALSGVEQALWDITGKEYGVPVYKLFGGPTRDRVRAYTHAYGSTPEALADHVQSVMKLGFNAVKFMSHPDGKHDWDENSQEIEETVARVRAVREAVGDKMDLLVDCHGRYSPAFAIKLGRALEPFDLYLLEEPVPPENVTSIKMVARQVKIPIAAGERRYTRYDFTEVCEKRALDIIQPDPCHTGGISELRKIAAMAEPHDIQVAPHNVGVISTVAAIHIDASITNFAIQEYWHYGLPHNCIKPALSIENGYFKLPTGPGLGFEVDEEILRASPYKQYVLDPKHRPDGSIANF